MISPPAVPRVQLAALGDVARLCPLARHRIDGAWGDTLLAVEVDDPGAIAEYEWVEGGKSLRERLVPAALINAVGDVSIADDE